jgi:hypothetical protein
MKEFLKVIFYGYKIHGASFMFATFCGIVFNAVLWILIYLFIKTNQ